jgi:hypothetical protein
VPKWRNWQTRYVQGVVGESLWEFESPLRHHSNPKRRSSHVAGSAASPDLDYAVLTHLRGYPEDLRRFSNLMKQSHPHGRTAVEFFLAREVAADSFVAALCRLVQSGEDIVTVVEAADLLGTPPARVLDLARSPGFPRPLSGEDRHQVWRRADIAAFRASDAPGAT